MNEDDRTARLSYPPGPMLTYPVLRDYEDATGVATVTFHAADVREIQRVTLDKPIRFSQVMYVTSAVRVLLVGMAEPGPLLMVDGPFGYEAETLARAVERARRPARGVFPMSGLRYGGWR